jgi:hypothetical protein
MATISGEMSCRNLISMLPNITASINTSVQMDEWKMLALDDTGHICNSLIINYDSSNVTYRHMLELCTQKKECDWPDEVQQLEKVVKTCLTRPHGNADSERSFSTNKNVVTSDQSCLHEDTLIAIRIVKDGIRIAGGLATDGPVTSEMLQRVRVSHAKFREWMAEQEQCRRTGETTKIN